MSLRDTSLLLELGPFIRHAALVYPGDARESDAAPWYERSLMVRLVVGSILHGEPIELFLVPASAPQLV